MSTKHLNAVFAAPLSLKHKMVLLVLCYHANEDGECYPSYKRITEKASIGERSAHAAITDLEQMNIIRCERNKGCKTFFTINDPANWTFDLPQNHRKVCATAENAPPQDLFATTANSAPEYRKTCGGSTANPAPSIYIQLNSNNLDIKSKGDESDFVPQPPPPKPPHYSPVEDLLARQVDPQTIADWLQHRKAKKAAVTQTVINRHASEAEKAGISLDEALQISCSRNWQGFEAKWVVSQTARINAPARGYESPRDKARREFMESLNPPTYGGGDVIDI